MLYPSKGTVTDPDTIDEYRAAFFLTFAEDHGLINEWSLLPERPETVPATDRRLCGYLPGTSLGMILTGS